MAAGECIQRAGRYTGSKGWRLARRFLSLQGSAYVSSFPRRRWNRNARPLSPAPGANQQPAYLTFRDFPDFVKSRYFAIMFSPKRRQ